ncbi:NAD-dependent epimerase/dehydratase family protein [Lutimonas zeaxanthinifaciens]|uniref:NAD-dependent epimerase/dehydratase family protein n=1 Tax=Lutimonas zeaxanthinifaciens TaxID=3060215 RepID=UPI00265D1DAA|nr:NAD-dependent epimerase/dehydratase family protein [Lutimonas sp. YSD2104]WKK66000.1 NAD-dependent epimerase/dehydratase family protein [Lutimonas sp. YSD2104]
MKLTRRNFVKKSGQIVLASPLLGSSLLSFSRTKKSKSLKILILGGTSFLGPHQIAYALSRGHKISTFTRGKSKPTVHRDKFDKVEQLIGDRENDLSAIEKGNWDLVIDNSGRKTEWTRKTAQLLKDRASLYMYTSSTGVYYPYLKDSVDEKDSVLLTEPKGKMDEETKLEYWYGVMKATSEEETIRAFGINRSIIIRPTYMMGPGDKTDRFIYWPIRLSRGGEMLIPGKAEDPVQYIDVRDVAKFMIHLAENNLAGTYNAAGPETVQGMHAFANEIKPTFNNEISYVYIQDYSFLQKNELPYLIPWIMPTGNNYGTARIKNNKAFKNGLKCRDLKISLRDTLAWWNSEALTQERRNRYENDPKGLLKREAMILSQWKKRGD